MICYTKNYLYLLHLSLIENLENQYLEFLKNWPLFIGDIVNLWKDKTMISKSDIIEECLSVDALYFKPDFQITINDCILGTAFDDTTKSLLPSGSFNEVY